jgi:hypothetical protein
MREYAVRRGWRSSLADLVLTLKELVELGIGFVSLAEALREQGKALTIST